MDRVVTPRLRQRYGLFTTGLIVGFLWGAWHFIVAFWGSGTAPGAFSLLLFLPQFLFYVTGTGLQDADGVGLRLYRKLACGNAYACKSHCF